MEKIVTALFCSPRNNSKSTRYGEMLLDHAGEGFRIHRFNAYDLNPSGCLDCGYCFGSIGCALNDLDGFMETFEKSDFFLISSPIYNGGFPSPAKAVIDRFQRYYGMRFGLNIKPPVEKHKKAFFIATSDSSEKRDFDHMSGTLRRQFTVLNTALTDAIFMNGIGNDRDLFLRESDKLIFIRSAENFFEKSLDK